MNPRQVKDLVRASRVIKAPNYHGGKHGLAFVEILAGLERCYAVEEDQRGNARGPHHPDGYIAKSRWSHRRTMAIEFNVHEDDDDGLLLLVTAYFL